VVVADDAVVDEQPAAVAERVAVGLLHGRPRRRAHVREEQRRLDASGDLAQVAIVPNRHDAPEENRGAGTGAVPADTEARAELDAWLMSRGETTQR
jgi:hypothetical protein